MNGNRRVKVVATVGPSSDDTDTLQKLVAAGVNVFRMNFSHGTHAEHARRYRLIREVEREAGFPLGVLVDLQGPKLRIVSRRLKSSRPAPCIMRRKKP